MNLDSMDKTRRTVINAVRVLNKAIYAVRGAMIEASLDTCNILDSALGDLDSVRGTLNESVDTLNEAMADDIFGSTQNAMDKAIDKAIDNAMDKVWGAIDKILEDLAVIDEADEGWAKAVAKAVDNAVDNAKKTWEISEAKAIDEAKQASKAVDNAVYTLKEALDRVVYNGKKTWEAEAMDKLQCDEDEAMDKLQCDEDETMDKDAMTWEDVTDAYEAKHGVAKILDNIKKNWEETNAKADEQSVAEFINSSLIITHPDAELGNGLTVYQHYQQWCKNNGTTASSRNKFHDNLVNININNSVKFNNIDINSANRDKKFTMGVMTEENNAKAKAKAKADEQNVASVP